MAPRPRDCQQGTTGTRGVDQHGGDQGAPRKPPRWPCQEMFGNRNVITKLMPIQTRICWGFAFTLSARTSSAPIRPKTAPEAPSGREHGAEPVHEGRAGERGKQVGARNRTARSPARVRAEHPEGQHVEREVHDLHVGESAAEQLPVRAVAPRAATDRSERRRRRPRRSRNPRRPTAHSPLGRSASRSTRRLVAPPVAMTVSHTNALIPIRTDVVRPGLPGRSPPYAVRPLRSPSRPRPRTWGSGSPPRRHACSPGRSCGRSAGIGCTTRDRGAGNGRHPGRRARFSLRSGRPRRTR